MKKLILSIAVLLPISLLSTIAAQAAEVTYKIELREISQPVDNDLFAIANGFKKDRGRSEWAVVDITDNTTVKLRHATRVSNMIGMSNWFDHKVTAIRMCRGEASDVNDTKKDCTIHKGDTVKLPTGKTIHDVTFDIKFTEGGVPYTRSVQVSDDRIPEAPVK
jgi:hypothetical protein